MKKTYLPIYIAFAVLIVGFIIGSFFDFQINDALFSSKNTFGLVISTIGTVPGYGVLAFIGGGCLYLGLKNKVPNLAFRIVIYVLAAAGYGLSIYFSGKEFFGPNVNIDIMHGKMKANEKYEIMQKFKRGEIDILVSTTVIEVGVDVPNATFIMIEDAGAFGLAELHQLRGRVGRGNIQSYALFVDTTSTEKSSKRLKVLLDSNDGFYIAEEDLKLRGSGDIFGIKQSGDMDFKIADIYTDVGVFREASVDAKEFVEKDIKITIALKDKLDEQLKLGLII